VKIIHKGQEMKKIQGLEVKALAFEDGCVKTICDLEF
jgi:hypothetical protein